MSHQQPVVRRDGASLWAFAGMIGLAATLPVRRDIHRGGPTVVGLGLMVLGCWSALAGWAGREG